MAATAAESRRPSAYSRLRCLTQTPRRRSTGEDAFCVGMEPPCSWSQRRSGSSCWRQPSGVVRCCGGGEAAAGRREVRGARTTRAAGRFIAQETRLGRESSPRANSGMQRHACGAANGDSNDDDDDDGGVDAQTHPEVIVEFNEFYQSPNEISVFELSWIDQRSFCKLLQSVDRQQPKFRPLFPARCCGLSADTQSPKFLKKRQHPACHGLFRKKCWGPP